MRTCLSREVPADHEARSQVKTKQRKSAAGVKALEGGLAPSVRRIQQLGDAPVHEREIQQYELKLR